MYCVLFERNIVKKLELVPIIREICAEEVKEIRHITGRGMSVCKKLAQRSKNVNSAVKLYNDIMNELHEGVRI